MIIKVTSKSSGKEYDVDTLALSCTCPHYMYRLVGTGQMCKHIKEVIENPEKYKPKEQEATNSDSIIEFIKQNNSAVDFVEKYSEEQLIQLKASGDVFEKHGILTVL